MTHANCEGCSNPFPDSELHHRTIRFPASLVGPQPVTLRVKFCDRCKHVWGREFKRLGCRVEQPRPP
jgi:hypothetical protein